MSRKRDERGAVLPFVAVLLTLLLAMAAFAVDLGMQRVVRRDMQALADVVALDLAHLVNGRTAAQIESGYNGFPTVVSELTKSVARNGDTLGNPPVVTYKLVYLDATTGALEQSGGDVKAYAGSEVPNAVWVHAEGSVDFAFASGSGSAVRTAVAQPSPTACFRLGSYAAGVDTEDAGLLNALLTGLVGTNVSAGLVTYRALASTDIGLLDLVEVDSLNVGTFDELMSLDGLTVGNFYAALATAVGSQGGDALAIELLESLAVNATAPTTIAIADILEIERDDSAALGAEFNLLDLVTAAAYAANGSHVLTVPGLGALVPSLGSVTSTLTVGSQPVPACGSEGTARAESAQVSASVGGTLADATLGTLTARTTVTTSLVLAQATGLLTDIVCGDPTEASSVEGIDVQISSAVVSSVSLTTSTRITGTLTVGFSTVTVDVTTPNSVSSSGSAPATTLQFRHPTDDYDTAKTLGSGVVLSGLAVPTVDPDARVTVTPVTGVSYTAKLSTIPAAQTAVTALLTTSTSAANATLGQVNSALAGPLAKFAGARIAGADLFAIPRPTCGDPALRG